MWWEKENHLTEIDGHLCIAGESIIKLAEKHGTPLFIYNRNRIERNYQKLIKAFKKTRFKNFHVHYAMKANRHKKILQLLNKLNCGIDATSPNEVNYALKTGFNASQIVFTGTSLSNTDLKTLAEKKCLINFDSLSSLKRFRGEEGQEVGLRVNSGIGLGKHKMIRTGGGESGGLPVKFGISKENLAQAIEIITQKKYKLQTIHHHVGSNWLGQNDNYFQALENLFEISRMIQKQLDYPIETIDLGGGYGVPFKKQEKEFDPDAFFGEVSERILNSGLDFKSAIVEPGNYLIRDAGILVVEVNTIEKKNNNYFAGVNAGLNVFNTSALYGYHHEIIPCFGPSAPTVQHITIAGNICETGDLFGIRRRMPLIREGDFLAIHNVGAYAAVMGNNYNFRPKAKEIIIS
jgi:diaminopimelate decarboxylase